jgi:hypothetical protein
MTKPGVKQERFGGKLTARGNEQTGFINLVLPPYELTFRPAVAFIQPLP